MHLRRFAFAPLIAFALLAACSAGGGLSGCAALDRVTGNTAVLGSTATDEKALYMAEAAMLGAETATKSAREAGLLVKGTPTAITVADALEGAHKALVVARQAYKAGDATTFSAKVHATQELVAVVWASIPHKET